MGRSGDAMLLVLPHPVIPALLDVAPGVGHQPHRYLCLLRRGQIQFLQVNRAECFGRVPGNRAARLVLKGWAQRHAVDECEIRQTEKKTGAPACTHDPASLSARDCRPTSCTHDPASLSARDCRPTYCTH